MAALFRSRGLKVTPQRECIFAILHDERSFSTAQVHPTAEAVYAVARMRMPTMSLKTVYQTLKDLAEMGEIQQLELGTGSSRFDPTTEPHHHLVCTGCGRVRDLYADFAVEVPADQRQGFLLGSAEVVFRGVCGDCQIYSDPRPDRPAAVS